MKFILILCLAFSNCHPPLKQVDQDDWPWNALLKVNQNKVPVYKDVERKQIAYYIMNDTIQEEFYLIKIIKREKELFKVKTASALSENKIRKGWIEIKNIGIYLRPRDTTFTYPVYDTPNKNSNFLNIKNESNALVDVLDINENWLKVAMEVKDQKITGWVPYEYLCPNPYTTCN